MIEQFITIYWTLMLKNANLKLFFIGFIVIFLMNSIHIYTTMNENENIRNLILMEETIDKNSLLINLAHTDKHNLIYITLVNIILSIILVLLYFKLKAEKKKNLFLNRKEKEFKDLQDALSLSEIISKTDVNGVITSVNDKFCEVSGYTQKELIGSTHNIIRHPDMQAKAFKIMWSTIQNKKVFKGILKNKRKDGTSYHVDSTIVPIINEDGDITEYIALRHYIEDMMNNKDVLQNIIKVSKNSVLILIKIEGFDQIEDFYTAEIVSKLEHRFFDKVLSYFPAKCRFDKVYKLENGEFAFITRLDENETISKEKTELIKKFQQNVKKANFLIDGYKFNPSILLSYSTGKDDIYENARLGLKVLLREKKTIINANGLTNIARENAQKNIDTIKIIKKAIKQENIISYYQPIYNNKTKKIEKYESLVRLVKSSGEILSPFFFLNVAKKAQYYHSITKIVIENNFKMLQNIEEEISINLSFLDIENDDTRKYIYNIIDNCTECHRVIIELLEDETAKDFNMIQEFIIKVKSKGIKIAIDDFGAGYSNFERLHDFQPDILKIDGSLIKNIATNSYSRNIVETIQEFANRQNIKTVAEFVDSKEIFEIVNEVGIDYTQGYYIGEPKPIS